MFVAILKRYWQEIAVGILIVLLAVWIGSLKFSLGSARGEVAKLTGQLSQAQADYRILEQKTLQQQAAVAQLEAESARKQKAGILALAAAKKRAVGLQAKADWLAEQLAKPPSGGTCASAFKAWRDQP